MASAEHIRRRVKKALGCDPEQAAQAVNATLEAIGSILEKDGELRLPGIGVLSVHQTPAHQARNPGTGEAVNVPDRHHVHFKAYKSLTDRVERTRQ